MVSLTPIFKAQEFFSRIIPHKNGSKVTYSLSNMTAWCDHFSRQDLITNVWPKTIQDLFQEVHIRFIAKGQGAVPVMYQFAKETLARFGELPEEYRETYSHTVSCAKGVLLLLGRVPFEGGSTLKDGGFCCRAWTKLFGSPCFSISSRMQSGVESQASSTLGHAFLLRLIVSRFSTPRSLK